MPLLTGGPVMLYPDLSHYSWDRAKGNPDWQALAVSGVQVVCIRASYGDPGGYNPATRYFREMATAAKAAGLWVGGYHNLVRGDDASIARQVDYFRAELDAAGADWAMLDVEPYQALRDNGLWPQLDDARRFEDRWDVVDARRRLVFYLARWFWGNPVDKFGLGSPDLTVLRGPLVNSNYPRSDLEDPAARYAAVGGNAGPGWEAYGGKTPAGWQFSSQVTWPGVSTTEDADAFRGTLADFKALTTKEAPVAWYLNRALTNFRNAVNEAYPNRDKTSDGTVGDLAHQSTSSDHNPDPAGESDAGSVDAWDMDVDLGTSENAAAIEHLKDVFEAHESSRYWIHNRKIASRSDGWVRRYYDGPNPHDKHVHWNTRESHEGSTAPWIIEEDDMPLSDTDIEKVATATKQKVLADGGMQMLFTRVYNLTASQAALTTAMGKLPAVVGAEGTNPTELAAALAALPKLDQTALAATVAEQVIAALPADGEPVSREDLEAALRSVLGSLDATQ